MQPGGEVLRIGDFRLAQVDVQVSELELSRVSLGQTVRIALDAFNGREITGRVDRISPQADPVSRLVPVTITVPNTSGKISAGLLARVRFGRTAQQKIVVPDSAFQVAQKPGQEGAPPGGSPAGGGSEGNGGSGQSGSASQNGGAGGNSGAGAASSPQGPAVAAQNNRATTARAAAAAQTAAEQNETVMVLVGDGQPIPEEKEDEKQDKGEKEDKGGKQAEPQERRPPPRAYAVELRQVRVGARADVQAEILSGLEPGDRVITRSSRPLKPGDTVRPGILSEEAIAEAEKIRQQARQQPQQNGGAEQGQRDSLTDLPRGRGAQSAGQTGQSSQPQSSSLGGGAAAAGGGGSNGGSSANTGGAGLGVSGGGGSAGSGGGLTGIGGPSSSGAAGAAGTGSGSSAGASGSGGGG